MNPLCIYHSKCVDGFGAACAVKLFYDMEHEGNIDFHAGDYKETYIPEVEGRSVIFVDFCYKPEVMLELASKAKDVLVLDHHKSAMECMLKMDVPDNVELIFNMGHSGAMLAWNHYFPDATPPHLLEYIEDRDLWRFSLPFCKEIAAALFSYPYEFDLWLSEFLVHDDIVLKRLIREGEGILRKQDKDIKELLPQMTRKMTIGGYTVPVANLPYTLAPDAANILAVGEPFAACYFDTPAGSTFSLRSDANGIDVSKIALEYGGGGHEHAAGFSIKRDWAKDI